MSAPPTTSDWYQDWFDEDYLALYPHRDDREAVCFVETIWNKLRLEAGVTVGDLPCGSGRHSKAFAKLGAQVTGLDLSEVMIRLAQQSAAGLYPQPRFLQGDLRELPFSTEFELVVNLFTSFGYFEQDSENERVFSELVRVLLPDGALLIDTVNPFWLIDNFLPQEIIKTDEYEADIEKELVDDNRRVIKRVHLTRQSRTRDITESVRLYQTEDFEDFSVRHGLHLLEFWGDYDGSLYSKTTPRLILLARK
ncbi:class I SAM-dependent methyltransferase [bacterium]|nr:MAG: class I SAM-dependent methyltransferase [bacterium]